MQVLSQGLCIQNSNLRPDQTKENPTAACGKLPLTAQTLQNNFATLRLSYISKFFEDSFIEISSIL